MNVLLDVYICSHRNKSVPLLPRGQQISKFTEDANWSKRKWHYSENKELSWKRYCQTLKAFRMISNKMKISLIILSWWCFSCLHKNMYAVYKSVVLKNNSLGTVDITFINEFQFLIFFFFFFWCSKRNQVHG